MAGPGAMPDMTMTEYNTLATPPPFNAAWESFSIVTVQGMVFIWACAALTPVALLIFTWKWARERRSHSRWHFRAPQVSQR